MPEVETTREGPVLTVTLNRPEVLNALDAGMQRGLAAALREAADPTVRAVVLTASGSAFCVGQDLAEFGTVDAGDGLRDRYRPNILALRGLEKPVIASINGAAAGAGLSLAAACDVRIAAEGAVFIPAFINLGLVPDAGGSFHLQRLLGYARAFEWLTSGHRLSAQEALEWGLVSAVFPGEELARHAVELAERYSHMPTRGIGLTKLLLDHAETATLEQQLELEARFQSTLARSPDFEEGLAAFRAQREPEFCGLAAPGHPVEISVADDGRRWRLTVLLRLLLAVPHFFVLAGFGLAAEAVALAGWFVTLVKGRLPDSMHGFIARYVCYNAHVTAYIYYLAEPYPSFRSEDPYPVDVTIAPSRPQTRWKVALRVVLVLPAVVFILALTGVLYAVQIAGFFVGLLVGRMPRGLRDLGVYCVRFQAQTNAYLFLLTETYPSLSSTITVRKTHEKTP